VLRRRKSRGSPVVSISSVGLKLNRSHSHRRLLILGILGRKINQKFLSRISRTLATSPQGPNKLLLKQISILSKLIKQRINN
jgi:hypothetical protein